MPYMPSIQGKLLGRGLQYHESSMWAWVAGVGGAPNFYGCGKSRVYIYGNNRAMAGNDAMKIRI
jgi:hypothetical protein